MKVRIDKNIARVNWLLIKIQAKKIQFLKHLKQRWHNPSGHSTPAFLIGSGRSGTNMIVSQLNKSWAVKLYNEDHPAAFHNWRIRNLDIIDRLISCSYAPLQSKVFHERIDTLLPRLQQKTKI